MRPSAYEKDNRGAGVAWAPEEEAESALRSLTNPELELVQTITLRQMQSSGSGTKLFLLGRVWYRLEQERRRRKQEVQELERLYFAP